MKQLVRSVKITGTGAYVPEIRVTNLDLEKKIDTNSKWIFEHLGINERRIANKEQCTSDLAALAGDMAIKNAGLDKDDIELIIVATATPDRLAPSSCH